MEEVINEGKEEGIKTTTKERGMERDSGNGKEAGREMGERKR